MGRKRSNYQCPRCGQKGFLRNNPVAVVHYEHSTRRRRTCYIKRLIDERGRVHVSADVSVEDPPKEFWGESGLYHKLGNMANRFYRIGDQLKKIQAGVYKLRPNPVTSAKCVKDLDIFERQFLDPVEKLLVPYSDQRWANNWTGWFKIQLDNFQYGPRAAGIINAEPTGQLLMEISKDKKDVTIFNVVKEFTSSQVKKNQPKTLELAYQLLRSHPLEKALNNWAHYVSHTEQIGDPLELYHRSIEKEIAKGTITKEEAERLLSNEP